MAESQTPTLPRVKLGNNGLQVSRIGFGCTNLNAFYDGSVSEGDAIAIVKDAVRKGVTFFDTSNLFESTEILLGQALKEFPREEFEIATKFGIVRIERDEPEIVVKGTPAYVRECCEASLRRLGLGYIDLYYQQRVDTSIPIEETMGELKKLVEEGKIKHVGLSEASADTIRRANAVHPISAVQMEWSLWTREIEDEIVPLCRELGIGIVAYSPLGRGFFGGKGVLEPLGKESFLASQPRFRAENMEMNKKMYARLDNVSKRRNCTPSQLALAWLIHQGDGVVPIPGTTKIKNLDSNIEAVGLKLTKNELDKIVECVPVDEIAGERTHENFIRRSWKFANTPLNANM